MRRRPSAAASRSAARSPRGRLRQGAASFAHRKIERRLLKVRGRDAAAAFLAIGAAPGPPEPVGRVGPGRVLRLDERRPFLAEAPQHGVTSPFVREGSRALGEVHRVAPRRAAAPEEEKRAIRSRSMSCTMRRARSGV